MAPALAGTAALAGASLLPFFPTYWPLLLGAAAAAVTAVTPRLGVALALAAPLLPLGNLSLGLALLWAGLAAGWLALTWRDPRSALLCLAGPLLAPLALVALVPLAVQKAPTHVLRAAQAAAAVALAAVAAGARGAELPFGLGRPPDAALGRSESPLEVARSLALAAPSELLLALAVLAAVAAAASFARGPWRAAVLAGALLGGVLLAAPSTPPFPLVLAAWATYAWAAVEPEDWRRLRARLGH